MRALALIAALAVLGLAAVGSSAGADQQSRQKRLVAAGSARFDAGGVSRVFRFSATQTRGTGATGWATVDYAKGPRLRVEISCLRVAGNRALVAGEISAATVKAHVGRTAVFGVEDGGAPAKDRFTFVYISDKGDAPFSCTRFPDAMALVKPTKGAARVGPSTSESA